MFIGPARNATRRPFFLRKKKQPRSRLDYFRFYVPSLDLDERRGCVGAF